LSAASTKKLKKSKPYKRKTTMDRWRLKAKAHKIRSKLLKADALVISLIRNPEASLEDIKKARESLLRMDKKAAEVERLIYTSNITKLNRLRRTSND
jgi:hypothetical protein